MVPQSRLYKPEYAAILLKIADGDLKSAAVLQRIGGGRPENVVYLTQQAVEKAIKAVLCSIKVPVLFTHDVEALLAILPASVGGPPDANTLISLTEYATVRRYEEGFYELSDRELVAVVEAGQRTLQWAANHVNGIS